MTDRHPYPILVLLVVLLSVQGIVRILNHDAQAAFFDEGYHIRYAMTLWSAGTPNLHEADGKILLYLWLNLLNTGDASTMLFVGRVAVALASLVTGAGIYLLGRWLHRPLTGIVALGLYIILPYALFYERMAMADPFAAMWVVLVAWRSLVFARKPSLRNTIITGALIAAATLAKLTVAIVLALPLLAIIASGRWRTRRQARHYATQLAIMAAVVGLLWSPLLVRLAIDTDVLYLNRTLIANRSAGYSLLDVWRATQPALDDYLLPYTLAVVVIGYGALGMVRRPRVQGFMLGWLLCMLVFPLFLTQVANSRYFVPIAPPLVLVVAIALMSLRRRWQQIAGAVPVVLWCVGFALPVSYTTVTAPQELRLSAINAALYQNGGLTVDAGIRQTAATLNQIHAGERVLVTHRLCYLIFYEMQVPIECLPYLAPHQRLADVLTQVDTGEIIYLLLNRTAPFYQRVDGVQHQLLARFERDHIANPVEMYHLWYIEGDTNDADQRETR